METLWQDLRYGARSLREQPSFALIAVLTLALGIGVNTAIFSVVNAVLLRPLPYPESERLIQIGRVNRGDLSLFALSEPKFLFLRDHAQSFEALTTATGAGADYYLSDESEAQYVSGLRVTAEFFRVTGVTPASGRGFTAVEDSPAGERVVVLSDQFWRQRFGADSSMIGQTIMLDDAAYTVVGIMPPGFEYLGTPDLLVPLRVNPASQNEGHNWTVIGRLKPGLTTEQARAELQLLSEQFRASYPQKMQEGESFGAQIWRVELTHDIQELLWLLLGSVGFILLIACANVAHLQLTRAAARQKEIAIRLALGAGSGRLLRQLMTEGIMLAVIGGCAGLLLAQWGLKALLGLVPPGLLPRVTEVNVDGWVLAFALGASLLTGLLFSLAPAWQSMRADLNRVLKEGGGKTGASASRGRLRSALVVVEVALALTLAVGAGLLLRTFANLRGVEPGFDANQVLSFELVPPNKSYDTVPKLNDLYRRTLERVRRLPGVESVGVTNKLPLDDRYNLPFRLAGQREWSGSTEYRLISPDYFRVMKMTVQRGRAFDDRDTSSAEPVIIVNEAFARRHFAGLDPLEQRLCVGCEYGDPALRQVVGIVSDTKQRNLLNAAPPAIFIPLSQTAEGVRQIAREANFVVRTEGDPLLLSAAIRAELRQLDPMTPVRKLRPLEQLIARAVGPQRFNLSLLGLFAGLGVLLAAVGIYGALAYRVAQSKHDIGIRLALGAQRSDVSRLVIERGMKPAILGVAFGLLASFGLTRWLESLLFGVSATDAATLAGVTLLLLLVALLACWIPARRATEVDPLTALRYE